MLLKIEPRTSIVWRNPFDLQLGVDPARVVLREVSPQWERLVAALIKGTSPTGFHISAQAAGVDESDERELLRVLGPVLERPRNRGGDSVAVVGDSPTAERIARCLAEAGALVSLSPRVTDVDCQAAVIVGGFVFDPEAYGFWLRRDRPHLPVLFGDTGVRIGPMVEPGTGPCLYCLERYRTEADPAWPAIASQLWGRRSPAETPLLSREVATRVTRLVLTRLADGAAPSASSVHIEPERGETRLTTWHPHPDCGCAGLPSESRTGSDSPDVAGRDVILLRPRTGTAVSARA